MRLPYEIIPPQKCCSAPWYSFSHKPRVFGRTAFLRGLGKLKWPKWSQLQSQSLQVVAAWANQYQVLGRRFETSDGRCSMCLVIWWSPASFSSRSHCTPWSVLSNNLFSPECTFYMKQRMKSLLVLIFSAVCIYWILLKCHKMIIIISLNLFILLYV